MRVVVPDASVLLKWVIPEEDDTALALRLRDSAVGGECILRAPSLWIFEVGNTIARRFPELAREMLQPLLDFELDDSDPPKAWLDTTLRLASTYRVTFYDAAYHALALVEHGTLVTADEQYARRAGAAGGVTMLAEWKPTTGLRP